MTANFFPVGNFARENLLQVVHLDVVDGYFAVHDRAHAHNAHLVVGELFRVGLVVELLFSEHVGIADLHSALHDLRNALARSTALNGDGDARIFGLELFSRGLDERLQRGRANGGNGARERFGFGRCSGIIARSRIGIARASNQAAQTGKNNGAARNSEEAAAAHGVVLHDVRSFRMMVPFHGFTS